MHTFSRVLFRDHTHFRGALFSRPLGLRVYPARSGADPGELKYFYKPSNQSGFLSTLNNHKFLC